MLITFDVRFVSLLVFIRFPLVCIEYVMRKTRALKTTTRIYLQDKNVWTDYIKFLSSGSKGGNAIH